MALQSWPLPKDPNEFLDYQFNWTSCLEAGETIATSEYTTTGSVTISDESISGALTTFWLSGGISGEACDITNRITTSEGRIHDCTARLRVRNR
jgi:hypothetical protein